MKWRREANCSNGESIIDDDGALFSRYYVKYLRLQPADEDVVLRAAVLEGVLALQKLDRRVAGDVIVNAGADELELCVQDKGDRGLGGQCRSKAKQKNGVECGACILTSARRYAAATSKATCANHAHAGEDKGFACLWAVGASHSGCTSDLMSVILARPSARACFLYVSMEPRPLGGLPQCQTLVLQTVTLMFLDRSKRDPRGPQARATTVLELPGCDSEAVGCCCDSEYSGPPSNRHGPIDLAETTLFIWLPCWPGEGWSGHSSLRLTLVTSSMICIGGAAAGVSQCVVVLAMGECLW